MAELKIPPLKNARHCQYTNFSRFSARPAGPRPCSPIFTCWGAAVSFFMSTLKAANKHAILPDVSFVPHYSAPPQAIAVSLVPGLLASSVLRDLVEPLREALERLAVRKGMD